MSQAGFLIPQHIKDTDLKGKQRTQKEIVGAYYS